MRGERRVLRLGERLVRLACRRLPPGSREERYREWAAELPAILHDPQIRPAPRRAVRMLSYAADTFRGTAMTPVRAWRRTPREAAALLLLAGLAALAWAVSTTVRAPGNGLNYLQLVQALLLVACPISMLVRSSALVPLLIGGSVLLVGAGTSLWDAAQSPGDWVNYFVAALILLVLLASWLSIRWARARHAGSPGSHGGAGGPGSAT